ncbi:MAG: hypothetical protein DMF74_14270 [Acidobacteria bacterium]|nr:MAG: hypothetical protein DMF74_14270 [Acidobacteriota bacterium]
MITTNGGSGINMSSGNATIQGNFIGLFSDGNPGEGGNRVAGVAVIGGSATIGGTAPGAGNVIAGNIDADIPSPAGTGAGIYLHRGSGSLVQGNFIGNLNGTKRLFTNVGVLIDGANNMIGGTTPEARNIISGNNDGIEIVNNGATNNVVQGNFIGTDASGSRPLGNSTGIFINVGSNNNLIGGTTASARNIISGNGAGIAVLGGSATQIQGNYIGLSSSGTAAITNHTGVEISGGSVIVGGSAPGAGNVISGNNINGTAEAGAGVHISVYLGGGTTQVLGNFIGTNPAGTGAIANRSGVVIEGAANNSIGGTTAAARNIISGNTETGIRIINAGATNNLVQGNFIGTDATGNNAIANGDGVQVGIGAQNNMIGGTATGAGNVISGNGSGVAVTGGSGTSIVGNIIGLNVSGIARVGFFGNDFAGVLISGGSATVGGTAPGSRNVISGNGGHNVSAVRPAQIFADGVGVIISGGTGSQVIGNLIGPDAAGTGTIANDSGVRIDGVANNVIGGTSSAARNIISGNEFGVGITGIGATNNVVQGNLITGNGEGGVGISGGATNNKIGGTVPGAGNTIANNGFGFGIFGTFEAGPGVSVSSGTGNAILGNAISSNGRLGIDLTPVFVTANDNCDGDTGANNLQNFPVITSAVTNSTTTTIQGTLNSTANTQFRIEFFANAACDPSGNGQGQTFLGFTNATTDASCNASFSLSIPNSVVTGPIITATATDSNNNTSEFSACASPMGTLPTIQFSAPAYTIGEGERLDIPITRSGDTSAAASVSFATSDLAGAQSCNVVNGVASSRCDYETRLATVKFAPGETSKIVSILIQDDSYLEGPETFSVRLSNAVGGFIGAPPEATVTITDNDLANGPNVNDTSPAFVRAHYLDFLSREPNQAGFDFWVNQITSCGSDQTCIQVKRINVSAAFFLSIEFQQTGYFVERIYKTAFGDAIGVSASGGYHQLKVPLLRFNDFISDTPQIADGWIVGQTGWEILMEEKQRAFTLDFVQRPRFLNSYATTMTPAQFVDRLFTNAGVTPSNTDRNAAIAEFGSATNTSDVSARARALRDVAENSILEQQELSRALVLMQYFGYLRRNPDDPPEFYHSGYEFWLNKLNSFNGDFQKAEIVKAFISSTEYRQRFGP